MNYARRKWRNAVDLHHLPEGTHSLAPKPGSLARLAFQKWFDWLLLAKCQRGGGLVNLPPPGFLGGVGFAVFPEKEGLREHEHPAKPLGQETVIAPVHDASVFHVFLSVKWSAWQELHLQPSRFERDASALGYTRRSLDAAW